MKVLQRGEEFLVKNSIGNTAIYRVFDVLNSSDGDVAKAHFRKRAHYMSDEDWEVIG